VIFVHVEDTFPRNARGQRRDRRECGRLRHHVNLSDVTHYKIPRFESFLVRKRMIGEYAPVKQKLGVQEDVWTTAKEQQLTYVFRKLRPKSLGVLILCHLCA
jgi:hypothetical protein